MKLFLASFLVCTWVSALEAPKGGVNLGTIEMWSEWTTETNLDGKEVCGQVLEYYNTLNHPRGFWGRLTQPDPIKTITRPLASGQIETRYFCNLRVKQFPVIQPNIN